MATLITRLPVSTAGAGPIIASSDIQPLSPFETEMENHWIFDTGNSDCLTDGLGDSTLTLQNSAPTYSGSYLTIPKTNGDALHTANTDVAAARDTIACVFRTSDVSGIAVMFGAYQSSSVGGCPFYTGGSLFQIYANAMATGAVGTVNADEWTFLAVSRDFTGATNKVNVALGSAAVDEFTDTGTYTPVSGGLISLGNAYYTSAAAGNMDFAEFMYSSEYFEPAQLSALYSRSKARMAGNGITVV